MNAICSTPLYKEVDDPCCFSTMQVGFSYYLYKGSDSNLIFS